MKLYEKTAHELRDLLRRKEISATEIVKSVLDRIESVDDLVRSFITITADLALDQAVRVDDALAKDKELPDLAGIPIAIKDNICTEGIRTTCASKILSNFVPPYDATVMSKLKESKSVLIGKANMDEFAMGSSTENSGFFITRNPWDLERVPGGSSGGSAASVAADETICAVGSDTGGSIRQPASLCGVVGMKPTYGRVSRFGLVAFASSLDQIGPITKDVEDCALMLNAICGHDPKDSTSANVPTPDFRRDLIPEIKGYRIGVPKEYFIEGIEPDVERAVKEGLVKLEELGAEIIEISLPHTEYAVADYYIIASAEASANLERYDGVKYGYRADGASDLIEMYKKTRSEGFGAEVKRRIMLGTYALSAGYYDAYYLKGLKVRTLIKQDFDRAFERIDAIVTPTSPTTSFKIGERMDDPLTMYLSDILTISTNLAGTCGISIPCGFCSKGLPIGMQIIGKPFDESTVIRVAYAFEQNTDYHLRKPELV